MPKESKVFRARVGVKLSVAAAGYCATGWWTKQTIMPQASHATFDGPLEAVRDVESAHPAVMAARVVHLTIYEDMAAVERLWRAFEQVADCTVFQSFDWLSTWWNHIGNPSGVVPAIVAGHDDQGRLLFLFPFGIETRRLTRRLTWLGTDRCDYNGPLLAVDFSAQVDAAHFARIWSDILQSLQDRPRLRFDVVSLEKMPECVGAQRSPFMAFAVTEHPDGAYLTDLADTWEAFYNAKRSSSIRKRDRYRRRKLSEFGDVAMKNPEAADDIVATLATLIEQKSRAFAKMGVANFFDAPGYRAFLYDLATNPRFRGLTHTSSLTVNSSMAAVNFGLQFRGRYYHLLASYDDNELSRFGAGTLHLQELLQYAVEHGFKQFDFTIGDERYKSEWCDGETVLFDYVTPVTLRGGPGALKIYAVRRIKRFIKRTPAVWDVAAKVRAFIGPLMRWLRR